MASWQPKIVYGAGPTTIVFPYPPDGDPLGEKLNANTNDFTSNLGNMQVQYNFTATTFTVTFSFLDVTTLNNLRIFFNAWGKFGKFFLYYPSQEVGTSYNVFLAKKEFNPSRQLADGSGDFLYKLSWTLQYNAV